MSDNPTRLPRQDAAQEYPIPGDVWNRLADLVEGAEVHVAPPLEISSLPGGGRLIRLIGAAATVPLKLTATETGSGFYKGRAFMGSATSIKDGTTALSLPGGMVDPGRDNALVFDPNAAGGGNSSLSPSSSSPIWTGGLQVGMTNENPSRGIYMLMQGGDAIRFIKTTTYGSNYRTLTGTPCDSIGTVSNTNTVTVNISTPNGYQPPPIDGATGKVHAYLPFGSSGLLVSPGYDGATFLCSLIQTGGSAGSSSAVSSYTYDIYQFAGISGGVPTTPTVNQLAAGLSPFSSPARAFPMTVTAAKLGLAVAMASGIYYLAIAFETAAGVKTC